MPMNAVHRFGLLKCRQTCAAQFTFWFCYSAQFLNAAH